MSPICFLTYVTRYFQRMTTVGEDVASDVIRENEIVDDVMQMNEKPDNTRISQESVECDCNSVMKLIPNNLKSNTIEETVTIHEKQQNIQKDIETLNKMMDIMINVGID